MRQLCLFSFCLVVGCADITEPRSEDLVTYTVTYDQGQWPARMIRIMPCDVTTGTCDVREPEGCRVADLESTRGELTGHICDLTIADGQPLAFNTQLEFRPFEIETDTILVWGCDQRPEIQLNLGSVRVYRDGVSVGHELDIYGDYCNFVVYP